MITDGDRKVALADATDSEPSLSSLNHASVNAQTTAKTVAFEPQAPTSPSCMYVNSEEGLNANENTPFLTPTASPDLPPAFTTSSSVQNIDAQPTHHFCPSCGRAPNVTPTMGRTCLSSCLNFRERFSPMREFTESLATTSRNTLSAYFLPMGDIDNWKALAHLWILDFMFAILALTCIVSAVIIGTSTIVILPVGLIFLFISLFSARMFARVEIRQQAFFHAGVIEDNALDKFPLFVRYREAAGANEAELGFVSGRHAHGSMSGMGLVKETSFIRNTISMFRDVYSYRALVYFLVIKPAVSLVTFIATQAFALPMVALIIPAPMTLVAVREVGMWQAKIALDTLVGGGPFIIGRGGIKL